MEPPALYRVLADAVLLAHVAFVAFVVVGQLLILAGGWRGWRWVRNPWFRTAHLAGIAVVVAQAWLGIICPLTTLEMWLREKAGPEAGAIYEGGFIQHWFQRILYLRLPLWMFTAGYTLFALAVVWSWWKVRPRGFADCRLPIADCRLPIADCRLPIVKTCPDPQSSIFNLQSSIFNLQSSIGNRQSPPHSSLKKICTMSSSAPMAAMRKKTMARPG